MWAVAASQIYLIGATCPNKKQVAEFCGNPICLVSVISFHLSNLTTAHYSSETKYAVAVCVLLLLTSLNDSKIRGLR